MTDHIWTLNGLRATLKKPLVAKAWYSDGILAYKVSLSSFHFHIHQHIVNMCMVVVKGSSHNTDYKACRVRYVWNGVGEFVRMPVQVGNTSSCYI